jgi:hypothetical protein
MKSSAAYLPQRITPMVAVVVQVALPLVAE